MTKAFIDSDVIMDLLLKRTPWDHEAFKVFAEIEAKKITGCTSPLILENIHYLLSKKFGKHGSAEFLRELVKVLKITKINSSTILEVLQSPVIKDLEDLIQLHSAIEAGCDYLITRNIKDYPSSSSIRVVTPLQFLMKNRES